LEAVGGWDPFNVTEDADLGLRLARFGYRCGTIDLPTLEEAPAELGPWLHQRTRWFKGWMRPVNTGANLRIFSAFNCVAGELWRPVATPSQQTT
jgi:cellulose synthase/poly-beta-1,6-N-acetylglucosamine synthase-like glycosyltransferase